MANVPALVWVALASASAGCHGQEAEATVRFSDSGWKVWQPMILLLHPRSTKPKNRRFPLAALSLAAVLEGREEFHIVDGNADPEPGRTLDRLAQASACTMLGVSVMPGPQMREAISLCREFRLRHPRIPIVWGGYFASLYSDTALNAPYVDVVVRGQGEQTLLDLVLALKEHRNLAGVAGISFKDHFGLHVHNPDRPLRLRTICLGCHITGCRMLKNTYSQRSWAVGLLCTRPA